MGGRVSIRVTVSCNGSWPGKPCSGRISFSPHMSAAKAREKAAATGWSNEASAGDFCPSCTRRRKRDRERRGAV